MQRRKELAKLFSHVLQRTLALSTSIQYKKPHPPAPSPKGKEGQAFVLCLSFVLTCQFLFFNQQNVQSFLHIQTSALYGCNSSPSGELEGAGFGFKKTFP